MHARNEADMGRPKGSKNVTEQKKFAAILLQRVNITHMTIGNQLNKPRSTIINILLRQASDTEANLSNRGRPVKLKPRCKRRLLRMVKKNRFKPTNQVASMFRTASRERLCVKTI